MTQRQKAIERTLRPLMSPRGCPESLRTAMAYCVLSDGKRFRPLLCLGGCEAVGGTWTVALPTASALELIHTYSLVHDDLPAMDNADTRRGKPSCHRRFGEAAAILVGDALLTLAFERLGAQRSPKALAAVREIALASGTAGLIGGQVLDLECAARSAECGAAQLEDVARRKTAALITASVVAGGLIGGGSSAQRRRLQRYGARLGLAFQLLDDLHDGDGLAGALSRRTVKARALSLIRQAHEAIEPFGRSAATLKELADWLASTAEAGTPMPTIRAPLTHART